MPMLIGLPGGPKRLEAESFKTPRQAIKIIEAGKGATTAGENGSLTAWRDRKGVLRGELNRFLRTVEGEKFTDTKSLVAWLKPRLIEIMQPNAEGAAKRAALTDDLTHVLGRLPE